MDISIKNDEKLQEELAREIAISEVERKFKLAAWRNGVVHLILISEHGWELSAYSIENEELQQRLQGIWQHNQWGDCIGRKTAKQIAKKMGYNLDRLVMEICWHEAILKRNIARRAISYHMDKIVEAHADGNEYFEKSYKGILPDIPEGAHFKVEISIVDKDGKLIHCSLDQEAE